MPTLKRLKRPDPPRDRDTRPEGRTRKDPRYQSASWQRLSASHRTQNPWCVLCREQGKWTSILPRTREEVKAGVKPRGALDHIIAVEDGGEFWDSNNHRGVCTSCHAKISAKQKRNR